MHRGWTATISIVLLTTLSGVCVQLFGAPPAFNAADRIADFVKVVLALPGPPPVHDPLGFDDLVQRYARSADYHGRIGVFHLTPLTMLSAIVSRQIFGAISPIILYLLLATTFMVALVVVVRRTRSGVAWSLAVALAYPALLVIDRGNLFAGVTGLCVVAALIRGRTDTLAACLFAVALDIRPNELLCAIPLLLLDWRWGLRLAIAGLAILVPAALVSHWALPTYNLHSFREGLQVYAQMYAVEGGGVPGGSSLHGALFALGLQQALLTSAVIGALPLAFAAWKFKVGAMRYDDLVFVSCAATALSSAVFANYHLLIFVAPLLMARDRLTFAASLLLLAPISVGWVNHYDAQVVINPAIMLLSSLWLVLRDSSPAPAAHVEAAGETKGRSALRNLPSSSSNETQTLASIAPSSAYSSM